MNASYKWKKFILRVLLSLGIPAFLVLFVGTFVFTYGAPTSPNEITNEVYLWKNHGDFYISIQKYEFLWIIRCIVFVIWPAIVITAGTLAAEKRKIEQKKRIDLLK